MPTIDNIITEHEEMFLGFVKEKLNNLEKELKVKNPDTVQKGKKTTPYEEFKESLVELTGSKDGNFEDYYLKTVAYWLDKAKTGENTTVKDPRLKNKVQKTESAIDNAMIVFYKQFEGKPLSNNLIESIKKVFPSGEDYLDGIHGINPIMMAYDTAKTKMVPNCGNLQFLDMYRKIIEILKSARKKMVDEIYITSDAEIADILENAPNTPAKSEIDTETQPISSNLTENYIIEYQLFEKKGGQYRPTEVKGELNDYLTDPDKTTFGRKETPENSIFHSIESILATDDKISSKHGWFEIATEDEQESKKGDLIYCDVSSNRTRIGNYNEKNELKNVSIEKGKYPAKEKVIRTLAPGTFQGNKCKSSLIIGDKYALSITLKEPDLKIAKVEPVKLATKQVVPN